MEKVKQLVNLYYEENLKERFFKSEVIARLAADKEKPAEIDWESSFFVRHRPISNIAEILDLSNEFR